ncbi:5893_t:CDS:2 [Paraglomus brasilianum]|uniref:5893_t:CDS:1 n=1 Tax=Paraglomus brasilianum TaxID=144538 RepID=A0A9N9D698_9GLOM|nr:5893_t:CDS:2 [Paraglomus brasilianum]
MSLKKSTNGTQQDKLREKHAKSTKPTRKTTFSRAAEFLIKHQIELPLAVISTIGMAYLCGVQQAEKFLFIKYRDPETGLYAKGKDDIYFVSFWVIVFTFLRAAVMEHLLIPIAKKEGIKTTTRFAEQGWLFIYYSTSWTLGMVSENTDVEKNAPIENWRKVY